MNARKFPFACSGSPQDVLRHQHTKLRRTKIFQRGSNNISQTLEHSRSSPAPRNDPPKRDEIIIIGTVNRGEKERQAGRKGEQQSWSLRSVPDMSRRVGVPEYSSVVQDGCWNLNGRCLESSVPKLSLSRTPPNHAAREAALSRQAVGFGPGDSHNHLARIPTVGEDRPQCFVFEDVDTTINTRMHTPGSDHNTPQTKWSNPSRFESARSVCLLIYFLRVFGIKHCASFVR